MEKYSHAYNFDIFEDSMEDLLYICRRFKELSDGISFVLFSKELRASRSWF